MALTSFASGALVTTQGWALLNLGSLVPLAVVALALGWLGLRQPPHWPLEPAMPRWLEHRIPRP
jgi:hypothetical protein